MAAGRDWPSASAEAQVAIGVVRIFLVLKLAAQDGVAEASFASARAVDDGGIGVEVHALFQPVEINGGDAGPFIGAARFLFHDRSEIDDIFGFTERRSRDRVGHSPSTNFFCSPCIRWISSSREVPRAKR